MYMYLFVHFQEEKKKFDRSSDKYYQSLERKLSAKKKELVGEVRNYIIGVAL